jgi:Ca2+/Na+ antiporter
MVFDYSYSYSYYPPHNPLHNDRSSSHRKKSKLLMMLDVFLLLLLLFVLCSFSDWFMAQPEGPFLCGLFLVWWSLSL